MNSLGQFVALISYFVHSAYTNEYVYVLQEIRVVGDFMGSQVILYKKKYIGNHFSNVIFFSEEDLVELRSVMLL